MKDSLVKSKDDEKQSIANDSVNKQPETVNTSVEDNSPEAIGMRDFQSKVEGGEEMQELGNYQDKISEGTKEEAQDKKPNNTGIPDALKASIEKISGYSLDDVKVHYNSDKPAAVEAYAYAEGTDIYIGPGQEEHLAHEVWHVVQQKGGKVKPTTKVEGEGAVNDDAGLEKEADVMGDKAVQSKSKEEDSTEELLQGDTDGKVIQRMIGLRIDTDSIVYTQQDLKRPPGLGKGGSQGDHSTPYTVLQDQVANAIEMVSLSDAWTNLMDTFITYTKLPGWDESIKHIKETTASFVLNLLKTKGDINALQGAVSNMLALRNQVALTSFPNGGHGNGEAKWAGSLQHQERQFQLGHTPQLKQKDVIGYMWKAFDHGRLNRMKSEAKQKAVLTQHAMTISDAYPLLSKATKIDTKVLLANYGKEDWASWSDS